MEKLAKLRFEIKDGIFMLAKVSDIETGLVIPVRNIKIDVGIKNWRDGIWATIEVPIDEIDLDGVLTKIKTVDEKDVQKGLS